MFEVIGQRDPRVLVEQIDKKLRSLRGPEMSDEVLERVAAWAADLRGAIPGLRERLDAELARLDRETGGDVGRAAAAHPAASWLLRRRAGKLSPDHLGCASPVQLLELARALA